MLPPQIFAANRDGYSTSDASIQAAVMFPSTAKPLNIFLLSMFKIVYVHLHEEK